MLAPRTLQRIAGMPHQRPLALASTVPSSSLLFLVLLWTAIATTTLTTLPTTPVRSVSALPTGAAGCQGGAAASVGFHSDYGPDSSSGRVGNTGSLLEFNTTLIINNVTMRTGNVTAFPGGRALTWTVTTGEALPMRGILLRVAPKGDEVEFTLTGDANLQDASYVCAAEAGNVEGITHISRILKPNATGTMRFDNNGIVDIDLTVVYMNGRVAPGDLSLFAYSRFQINIENSPRVPPVPAPVAPPPTASPVEDRCATNECDAFLGLPGRLYNRFRAGECQERCSAFRFFTAAFAGWRCGACF